MNKKFFSLLMAAVIVLMLAAVKCKKGAGPPVEENLIISTDAPLYSETPGSNFSFILRVESAMPLSGVKIDFEVKGETDNQVYPQGPSIETLSSLTRISLVGLPRQKICICTVTVTSKSKSTNKATTSFRIVFK